MSQVEVFRAKNRLYNELLQHETGNDITQSIGNQLLYLNRVVPRSEIATRISNIEQQHLSRVARNWFFDSVKLEFFGKKLIGNFFRISLPSLGAPLAILWLSVTTIDPLEEVLWDGMVMLISILIKQIIYKFSHCVDLPIRYHSQPSLYEIKN